MKNLAHCLAVLLGWLIIQPFPVQGQSIPMKADSLLARLTHRQPDSVKVRLLVQVSQAYETSAPDSALSFAKRALTLSRQTGFREGILLSLKQLGSAYTSQGDFKQALVHFQQLLQYARQGKNIRVEAEALRNIANVNTKQGSYPVALSLYQQSLNAFRQVQDSAGIGSSLHSIGGVYKHKGEYKQALTYFKQALRIRHQLGDKLAIAATLNNMGTVFKQQGQLPQALTSYLQALQLLDALGDRKMLPTLLNNIGNIYLYNNGPSQALAYHCRALKLAQVAQDHYLLAYCFQNVANDYLDLKAYEQSLDNFQQALHIARQIGDKEGEAGTLHGLGKLYGVQGKYGQAIGQFKLSLRKHREIGNQSGILFALKHLGITYRQQGQYKLANSYLHKALLLANAMSVKESQMELYEQLSSVDSARGNMIAALGHYKQYVALKDSLFGIEKTRQLAQLQTKYETEKKEGQIHRLRQQAKIQELALNQQAYLRNLIIVGLLLMSITAAALYNRYRVKQKVNHQLENQKREIEQKNYSLEVTQDQLQALLREKELLMQEIHHRAKNNLSIVENLLVSQSRHLTDEHALMALQESSSRVHSISLIHQQLYQSGNPSRIALKPYLEALVSNLEGSILCGKQVEIVACIQEVTVDVDLALPLGLIVNEVVTNALKYAFLPEQVGTVNIILQHVSGTHLDLTIADNGTGLPFDAYDHSESSMGLRIVRGLVRQVGGQMDFFNEEGCCFHLLIPLTKAVLLPTVSTMA